MAEPGPPPKSERILEAARHLLATHGYRAVTVDQIAQAAGVSRGLLHYYFASKEELLAKVVRRNIETSLARSRELFKAVSDTTSLVNAFVEAYFAVLERDPSLYTSSFEAFVQGRHQPAVASELADLYAARRAAIAEGLAEAGRRGLIAPPADPQGLASLLIAIADGVALQALIDPELATERIADTAAPLLVEILEPSA